YDAFCNATGRHREQADFDQEATHPVVKVNWFDADAFCKWLTEKERGENFLEQGRAYRLPTDLEWSMAARLPEENGATPEARDGKIKNEFPWGKQWPPPNGAGNYADQSAKRRVAAVIQNYVDNFAQTSPVGNFKPNAFGFSISAATSGNGAPTRTRAITRLRAGTGAFCAAAPGPPAIASKCNPHIGT